MNVMDPEEMIALLKQQPQTYETLLKEQFDNRNTITNLLRNKISTWIHWKFISCGVLDGTRLGKKIFIHNEKDYYIIITRIKNIFEYYYCYDIQEVDETLILKQSHKLDKFNWLPEGDKIIHKNELIRYY
jgi:hypothetical protein